ncbi:MAG: 4Fe-4S dicluster domain-containing protein [Candidatus Aerophobetes bacterium]
MAEEKIISMSELDSNFKYEVTKEPGGENIMRCFTCGTCPAGCPVREIDDRYDPRKIIRMVVLGMKERVLSSDFVWLCSGCYTCQERCPQDVRITDVMSVLKNLAAKEGYLHPSLAKQAELIQRYGRLYEIDEFDNKKRGRVGLPPIVMNGKETEEIFKMTGIDKLAVPKGGE